MSENYASPWGVWYVGRIGSPMYAARARLVIRHSASFIELDGTVGLLPRRAYEVYAAPQEQMPDPLDQVAWALGLTLAKPAEKTAAAAEAAAAVNSAFAGVSVVSCGWVGGDEASMELHEFIPYGEGYVIVRCEHDKAEALGELIDKAGAVAAASTTGGNHE